MGTNFSRNISTNILDNTVKKSTSITQSIATTNLSEIVIHQTVNLIVLGKLECSGSLIIKNTGESTQNALANVTAQQFVDMTEDIKQNIAAEITAETEQANKDLALGLVNISATVNKTITDNSVDIETSIENAVSSTIEQSTNSDQTINVTIGPSGLIQVKGDCIFSNEMTVVMITSNSVAAVQDVLYATDYGQEVIAKIVSKTKQTNEGVDVTLIVVIVIVILVVIGIITGVVKYSIDKKHAGK